MKRRLLFISTIFPSKLAQRHATYNAQLMSSLENYFNIDVINPISWIHKTRDKISYTESRDAITIYHPTYWYTPRVLRGYYGLFYYLSIKSCLSKLMKEKKYDAVFSSWLYPDGWTASHISSLYGIPVYLMAIGTDGNRLVKGSMVATHTVEAISRANKTISVSKALREKLIAVGADPDKIIVIHTGVDRAIFRKMDKTIIRNELGFAVNDPLILFVGNLIKTKGLDELADAFGSLASDDQFRSVKLVIAGTGQYENGFKKRLKAIGMFHRTFFKGSCSLPVVAKLMNAADVVCLPSYSEGLPNVVLEALSCNTKVVASDVGGIPELKENHENLYLVPPRDSVRLATALKLALNAECLKDQAHDLESWEEIAKKLDVLFREVTN